MSYGEFHKYYKYGWYFAFIAVVIGLIIRLIEFLFNIVIIKP